MVEECALLLSFGKLRVKGGPCYDMKCSTLKSNVCRFSYIILSHRWSLAPKYVPPTGVFV